MPEPPTTPDDENRCEVGFEMPSRLAPKRSEAALKRGVFRAAPHVGGAAEPAASHGDRSPGVLIAIRSEFADPR